MYTRYATVLIFGKIRVLQPRFERSSKYSPFPRGSGMVFLLTLKWIVTARFRQRVLTSGYGLLTSKLMVPFERGDFPEYFGTTFE